MLSAYLLVSHGSSDARHQAGLSRLANLMRQHLDRTLREEAPPGPAVQSRLIGLSAVYAEQAASLEAYRSQSHRFRRARAEARAQYPPAPIVGTATLEATPIPLSQQITMFAKRAAAQGVRQVILVPLFLLAGIHVKEDLPAEIAKAESSLPTTVQLLCLPHLGAHDSFKRFVVARLRAAQVDRCLLLAHGSRRKAGNRSVQQLGTILDAEVAFWTVSPDLETQVIELMQQGYQYIAIAPYFLFPGSITDAIICYTEDLAERLPKLSLRLLAPLGTSAELGKVIAEMVSDLSPVPRSSASEYERWPTAKDSITA